MCDYDPLVLSHNSKGCVIFIKLFQWQLFKKPKMTFIPNLQWFLLSKSSQRFFKCVKVNSSTNSSRYQFISSSFGCRSRYSSKGVLKEFCQLSSHSVENKFYEIQPTPRGVFTFTLISPPKNVTEMTSLKILFSGSYKKKGKRRQRENTKE